MNFRDKSTWEALTAMAAVLIFLTLALCWLVPRLSTWSGALDTVLTYLAAGYVLSVVRESAAAIIRYAKNVQK